MEIENEYCEVDYDCENDKPCYYTGFYVIWKGIYPIHTDYFIFDSQEADEEYKADRLLWDKHTIDFNKNRFSELNQAIGNLDDIDITIEESHLFDESYSYEDIENEILEQYDIFREKIEEDFGDGEQTLCKKKKDNYNMSNLMDALEQDLLLEELFGED